MYNPTVSYALYKNGKKIGTQVIVGSVQYLKKDGEAITTFGFTGPYLDLNDNYIEYCAPMDIKIIKEKL